MHINHWGPVYWNFLHANAEIYHNKPLQFKLDFMQYFTSLIPCTECKDHFSNYQKTNPIEDTTNIIKWAFHAHNNVNQRLNKNLLSWEEYQLLYDQSSQSLLDRICTTCNYTPYIVVLVLIILLIVFFLAISYIYYKNKNNT